MFDNDDVLSPPVRPLSKLVEIDWNRGGFVIKNVKIMEWRPTLGIARVGTAHKTERV